MSRELSLARQMAILSEIARFADDAPAYEAQLVARGFSAFRAFTEATASFCGEGETDLHSRYDIEVAKLFIGTPSGIPGHLALKRSDAWRSIRRYTNRVGAILDRTVTGICSTSGVRP